MKASHAGAYGCACRLLTNAGNTGLTQRSASCARQNQARWSSLTRSRHGAKEPRSIRLSIRAFDQAAANARHEGCGGRRSHRAASRARWHRDRRAVTVDGVPRATWWSKDLLLELHSPEAFVQERGVEDVVGLYSLGIDGGRDASRVYGEYVCRTEMNTARGALHAFVATVFRRRLAVEAPPSRLQTSTLMRSLLGYDSRR